MIEQWLEDYKILSQEDLLSAKREIMQQVALAGLARGGFFEHATFYGGTALRIFYGLDRYSEDLDFSLNYKDAAFSLETFFDAIKQEFILLGLDVEINLKQKRSVSPVESAFLKENTIWGLITLGEKSRHPIELEASSAQNICALFLSECDVNCGIGRNCRLSR